jgi:hypothetical protein
MHSDRHYSCSAVLRITECLGHAFLLQPTLAVIAAAFKHCSCTHASSTPAALATAVAQQSQSTVCVCIAKYHDANLNIASGSLPQ